MASNARCRRRLSHATWGTCRRSRTCLSTLNDDIALENANRSTYLGVAIPGRIRWERLPQLDKSDADARIIAEILHTTGVEQSSRLFLSHDLKPIILARQFEIPAQRVADTWLKPKEPSRGEKETQRLKQQLAELRKTEPELEASITLSEDSPTIYSVSRLTNAEKKLLIAAVMNRNPAPRKEGSLNNLQASLNRPNRGHISEAAYRVFQDKAVPEFIDLFPAYLENTFAQIPLSIEIRNVGQIRAQNLIITVDVRQGWLNDRPLKYPFKGPAPKRSEMFSSPIALALNSNLRIPSAVGRHELEIVKQPERTQSMEIHCQDFPYGGRWIFGGVVGFHPAAAEDLEIRVSMTAANLHGEAVRRRDFSPVVSPASTSDLYDVNNGNFIIFPAIHPTIEQLIKNEKYDEIEFISPPEYDEGI